MSVRCTCGETASVAYCEYCQRAINAAQWSQATTHSISIVPDLASRVSSLRLWIKGRILVAKCGFKPQYSAEDVIELMKEAEKILDGGKL